MLVPSLLFVCGHMHSFKVGFKVHIMTNQHLFLFFFTQKKDSTGDEDDNDKEEERDDEEEEDVSDENDPPDRKESGEFLYASSPVPEAEVSKDKKRGKEQIISIRCSEHAMNCIYNTTTSHPVVSTGSLSK